MRRHLGGIWLGGIWEASGKHLGGIWEASGGHLASGRHLGGIWEVGGWGGIWEASGGHLGVIWETFGSHLGAIWEAFGIHLETSGRMKAEEASGGQISYYVPPSATECKSSFKISISQTVFQGTIAFVLVFTTIYARRHPRTYPDMRQGPSYQHR